MAIYQKLDDLVGNTPLLALWNIKRELGLSANLFAKLESFNPASSAKDRVALSMIQDAEEKGNLLPGYTIIEPTSGNTGIGLAAIGTARGYRVLIVMPDSMSIERQKLMRAYGAEVVLTPGALGMKGAIDKAEELASASDTAIIAGQFENPANPKAHYETTGPEIFRDTSGEIDIFVAGIGTGGTISGTGKYLKEKKPTVQIVGVEPCDSPLLTEGKAGAHKIQGIGANFVPKNLEKEVLDDVLTVSGDDAMRCARLVAHKEGLLVGISSGAALAAAIELARRPENKDKSIVVLFPDTGEHYLSTELFS